ncbi:amidophosphoribosyltransferase [Candidatus Woesearchaeota archaeon]|nr:amidophosphoribosyltransferase [Candidatus Woesearchaeota archaeon]
MLDEIHEECGIAAVYIKGNSNSANKALFYLYRLLLNLQNRGQLSAGVTTHDPKRNQLLDTHKDLGHVNEVFRTSDKAKSFEIFKKYAGSKGIGHVRYATSGTEGKGVAQPFERHHGRKWKWFAFGFNGNLANYTELKRKLLSSGEIHLTYDNDTEIILHNITNILNEHKKRPDMAKVFGELAKKFDGCYNISYINAEGEIVVCRDPHGFRPLVYGFSDDKKVFMAASESNALLNCGIKKIKPLQPGYMVHIVNDKVRIRKFAESKKISHCMFEWVYFSNVSSVLDNKSVYITRTRLGKELAKLETEKVNAEDYVVVPVPDTAKASGDAYAFELGVPSREGIIRNRYVGRTFIEGSSRYDRVQSKYTALKRVLRGKKVLLTDDSIVRGATTKQLVRYLKEDGEAKEVHLRISCPPLRGPCFYGIDMSTISELLVPSFEGKPVSGNITKQTCAKIAKHLGADSLIYQSIEGLVKSIRMPSKKLCMACINGRYPTPCGKKLFKKAWEYHNKGSKKRVISGMC